MRVRALINSTGNEKADHALLGLIAAVEEAFPNHVLGYYVGGSHGDASGIDNTRSHCSSDIDLFILLKEAMDPAEAQAFQAVTDKYSQSSPIELDIHAVSEEELSESGDPNIISNILKLGSLLVYGQDIRERWGLMPLASYIFAAIHHSLFHIGAPRQGDHIAQLPLAIPLTYPVAFPEPDAEFFGYDRPIKQRNGEYHYHGTRRLTAIIGWIATTELALRTSQYVARKSDAIKLYRERIADEWTELIETIYHKCKREWHYQIPDRREERLQLCAWCRQTLALENAYLHECKAFVVAQLQNPRDKHKFEALEALQNIAYPDDRIAEAVAVLTQSGNEALRQMAQQTLRRAYPLFSKINGS